MTNTVPLFGCTTAEDLSFEMSFTGMPSDLSGRTFSMAITDRPGGAVKATLTIGAGLSLKVGDNNTMQVYLAKATMASWPKNIDYTADLIETTGGKAIRILPIRLAFYEPGRMYDGQVYRSAVINWGGAKAVVASMGGSAGPRGLPGFDAANYDTLVEANAALEDVPESGGVYVLDDGENNGFYVKQDGALVLKSTMTLPAVSAQVEDISDNVSELAEGTGQPYSGAVPGDWVEAEVDRSGLFVRGRDSQDYDYRALAASIAPQEKPPAKIVNWSDWQEAQIDSDGLLVRGVGLDGVTYISRGGRVIPWTNALMLQSAVAYGDSTTQGNGYAYASLWTTILAASLGIDIANRGANGQTAAQIAARMTGIIPRATVTGGSIPASGTVGITATSIDLFVVAGVYAPRTVDLIADDGTRVRGRLDRTGTSAYTFTRYEAGAAVTTAGVDIYSVRGWEDCAKHALIGMGINDETGIVAATTTIDQVKEWYRAATSACRGGYTVWGLLDRGVSEGAGTTIGDYIRAMEAWFRAEYGANYCPVRVYLSSQRALDDAMRLEPTFTPTSDDFAAVAAGCVPPSFRDGSGSVHLQARGYALQALCFERHLRLRFNI